MSSLFVCKWDFTSIVKQINKRTNKQKYSHFGLSENTIISAIVGGIRIIIIIDIICTDIYALFPVIAALYMY